MYNSSQQENQHRSSASWLAFERSEQTQKNTVAVLLQLIARPLCDPPDDRPLPILPSHVITGGGAYNCPSHPLDRLLSSSFLFVPFRRPPPHSPSSVCLASISTIRASPLILPLPVCAPPPDAFVNSISFPYSDILPKYVVSSRNPSVVHCDLRFNPRSLKSYGPCLFSRSTRQLPCS